MIDWYTPELKDLSLLKDVAVYSNSFNNDCNAINVILYSKKFRTKISKIDCFLVKKICTEKEKKLYSFPLPMLKIEDPQNFFYEKKLKLVIEQLFEDSKPDSFEFSMLSENQKNLIEKLFPNEFSFEETLNSEDYIYLTKNLADLPGKKFHKKKNHINQFKKKYNQYYVEKINELNKNNILIIEDNWFEENEGSNNFDKLYEKQIITELVNNYDKYDITGIILYAENKPCAFCIASELTQNVIDVHFEKAIFPFNKDGAYSVINNEFSKTKINYKYINREEDLGIEGLRKAKMSYYPEIILRKWNGRRG